MVQLIYRGGNQRNEGEQKNQNKNPTRKEHNDNICG